jgi:hypothetical protein
MGGWVIELELLTLDVGRVTGSETILRGGHRAACDAFDVGFGAFGEAVGLDERGWSGLAVLCLPWGAQVGHPTLTARITSHQVAYWVPHIGTVAITAQFFGDRRETATRRHAERLQKDTEARISSTVLSRPRIRPSRPRCLSQTAANAAPRKLRLEASRLVVRFADSPDQRKASSKAAGMTSTVRTPRPGERSLHTNSRTSPGTRARACPPR